ncbi:hypothetical protein [Amycolatopsis sp. lyj-109]|uniref:hypothetical protein n=1 Tax=Amycolatopsis sp. lyj-109 TaxID=2789287 RepID=UPI00397B5BDA
MSHSRRSNPRVIADGERRSRLRWTRDVLPEALAGPMAEAMARGLEVVKRTRDPA